jgi:hypothetical protein
MIIISQKITHLIKSNLSKEEREMRRAMTIAFLIFMLMHIEVQAQTYSILTGTVTEVHSRYLVIRSDDGGIIQLRVGTRTVYPTRIPAVGDKVKVEYLLNREVHIGYSVAILESPRKDIGPQKKVIESQTKLPSQEQTEWLLGLWKGILPGKSKTRLLDILTIKRVDGRKMEAKGNYGMASQEMNPITMTLLPEQNSIIQISFTLSPRVDFEISKTPPG